MKKFEWYFFASICNMERKKEIILMSIDDQGKLDGTQEYGNYK